MTRFVLLAVALGVGVLSVSRPPAQDKKADPIVGTYDWYSGAMFVIREDGTATAQLGHKKWAVRWVANPYGGYVLMYDDGGVDVVRLRPGFRRLEGTGVSRGKAYPVSGTKR